MMVTVSDTVGLRSTAMAARLRDFYDERVVRGIARELEPACPGFDQAAFVRECLEGLAALELTGRAWHIAEALDRHLPRPFARAGEVLLSALGAAPAASGGAALEPFRYLPHVFLVQKYGLGDFELSMRLQYQLTQRFSAESSIRAFLAAYPDATYARLCEWATDPSVHVRRLVSEGTRPRLPWAPRLRAFQADPEPVLALLELLKDDPERYVQRSVANNLNDIGKDHPDRAAEICQRWLIDAPPARRWIVKHALRSLIKAGHRGALATLGVAARPRVEILAVRLSARKVRLGGGLRFSFELKSAAAREQSLMVDYAVHYVKANGATRAKVFKLRKLTLAAGARVKLTSSVSFVDLTTRRHYPGLHRIELRINGVAHELGSFRVEPR
jgi:3-methyladenine DNA glycosylase AlkC